MELQLCTPEEQSESWETVRYATRLVYYADARFALNFYPSLLESCQLAYAPIVTCLFMKSNDVTYRRNLLHLALSWRYAAFEGFPTVSSSSIFVVQYYEKMLSSVAPLGSQIKHAMDENVLVNMLCLDAEHTVDEKVYAECQAYFNEETPLYMPKHILMYALCLTTKVPWKLRNLIVRTTKLVHPPVTRVIPEAEFRKNADFDHEKFEPDSQFKLAETSRVLGSLQFLENSSHPEPSKAFMNRHHVDIPCYRVGRAKTKS